MVQANHAAPMKRMLYYFEVNVINRGQMTVGFTTSAFQDGRQPSWEANCCGYNDDGLFYRGRRREVVPGQIFTNGDTVGVGINNETQQFFFTSNGQLLHTFNKDFKGPMFPTVSVHSRHEEASVNFGQGDFVFDLTAYEAGERIEDNVSIPQEASYGIIRSYLQHYGYGETLQQLDTDLESKTTVPEDGDEDYTYEFDHRKILREKINSGKIDETFSTLGEWHPQIIEADLHFAT
ncbi:ran-binding protein M homolog [Salvia splendens]|uniref:ran-binding protein M homolog n=1 Tax=Salvia splendens TaxID=180675 RepID=UPI001C27C7FE|nr:ran-binding protein M homolog [Salvia splendens]